MNASQVAGVCWDTSLKLTGDRLYLRPLTAQDVNETYVGWLADPRVNAFLETRWEDHDIQSIASFVQEQSNDGSTLFLGIFLKNSDTHIGNIKLGPINSRHMCGDISYFLGDVTSWGRGFATEAIKLVVDCGFQRLGLHRIQAGCYEANIGSAKALEKVGFRYEGTWRRHVLDADGQWQDHLWFGLLAEEWGVS